MGFVCMFFDQPAILIGGLGMAVAEHFFKKFFTKEFTLTIQLPNLAVVRRNGPFVTIIMKEPPAAGLRKVKFFVGESYRETFVKEFNRVFPGMFR